MTGPGAAAPLIVRVAGLPGETVAPFSHARLVEVLAERERLREQLDQARAALVDCLHGAVRGAAREERRFLLSIKRSCFNGGTLKELRQDPQWPLLASIASALVDTAVTLESAAEEAEARFEELYRSALRRERESLVQLLENRAFVRGVALASPSLAPNLDRLNGREPDTFGRREKRLGLTLLRYASRAALKLSPLSTLTRTGVALSVDDAAADFSFLPGAAWKERSTVSLRRELLAQCSCLLLRCSAFAEGLEVALNETLAFDGDGRCSFFRTGCWEFEDESRAFRYRDASTVKASLEGPLVPWLLTELSGGSRTYRHLLDRAGIALQDEDRDLIAQGIAELLGIGFLSFILPWDFSAPDLERQMLDALDMVSSDAALDGFRSGLRELTGLLGGYAEAGSPARLLATSQSGVEGLFRALAPVAGLDPRIEFKAYDKTFEEDVFLLPGAERGAPRGIVHLSRNRMHELLENLDPLARLISLQSSLHDLRYTLAAFVERRWPGAEDVGLLELFDAVRPLFDQYLRFGAGLSGKSASSGFNPLGLESVRSLALGRQKAREGLNGCFEEGDDGQRLCLRALAALLDQISDSPIHPYAFCAFVQPLDPSGQRWVLNSITDGFGRLGSRFTASMDARTRDGWTSYFTARSLLDLDGERIELLDVTCPENRTINVHVPQTRRVLRMPGEYTALPTERVLRLSDLRVRRRGAEPVPVLTDRTGQRLFPVQLGSLAAGGTPTLLKFLGVFGPGERHWRLPVRAPRKEDGTEVFDRHIAGPLVYSRKKWIAVPRELLSQIEGYGETKVFETVNRWRLAKGIPDRVFVKEPILVAGSRYRHKPQYISFSSPSFVQMFQSMLKADTESLVLEEALPVHEQFPPREGGWAAEVQLESFAFRCEFFPLVMCERNQSQPAEQA